MMTRSLFRGARVVLIEHQVEMTDDAAIEALEGESIHVRGAKVINGDTRITRTPLLGAL